MTSTCTCFHDEVLDFLLSSPTPAQIIAFRASDQAQERLQLLLKASRTRALDPTEQTELDAACEMVHLFKQLKAKARRDALKNPSVVGQQLAGV